MRRVTPVNNTLLCPLFHESINWRKCEGKCSGDLAVAWERLRASLSFWVCGENLEGHNCAQAMAPHSLSRPDLAGPVQLPQSPARLPHGGTQQPPGSSPEATDTFLPHRVHWHPEAPCALLRRTLWQEEALSPVVEASAAIAPISVGSSSTCKSQLPLRQGPIRGARCQGSQSGGRETRSRPRLLLRGAGLSVLSWPPAFQKEALSLLTQESPCYTRNRFTFGLCVLLFTPWGDLKHQVFGTKEAPSLICVRAASLDLDSSCSREVN